MKAIMAMASNRVIGKNNTLPWPPIKEDFKWFKEFTMGKTLIVGRKTYDNLPRLKGRNLVVITHHYLTLFTECILHPKSETMYTRSYEEMIENITEPSEPGDETFKDAIIAGGASMYKIFLPYITEFYVTHINGEYDGDTYMVEFEHMFNKQEIVKEFTGGHKVIKYYENNTIKTI